MIKYPDGKTFVEEQKKERKRDDSKNYLLANMGMNFENDVSKSCEFYKIHEIALIYKRPTPIKVVKMDKEKKGMISQAYFQEKSVTDYVGLYRGKYIDFECKETIHDSVPYSMIREQQYRHLFYVNKLGGIGFFLISFKRYQEVYLIDSKVILNEIERKKHPVFKREFIRDNGVLDERSYTPPYKIIDAVDKVYF